MSTTTVLIALAIAAVFLLAIVRGGGLPRTYARRNCQGKAWRNAFHDSSNAEIRDFLSMFVQAFAFSEKEKLKLRPDDSILSIYRAIYSHRWIAADALELETLAEAFETKYGKSLKSQWSEALTLGKLFAYTQTESYGLQQRIPQAGQMNATPTKRH